jgi:hypothetical protein
MVSEVYDAFVEAGVPKPKARAAAEAIPISDQLATKKDMGDLKSEIGEVKSELAGVKAHLKVSTASLENKISGVESDLKSDIVTLEAKMWRAGITIAGLAVLLNRFLDWVIPGK